jgi:type II secretory pathway pseudopilin PulG
MTTLALPSLSFSRPLTLRRSRAFGLLEVILVFAIVIGAAAVTFTVFSSANGSAEAANQAEAMSAVVANIQALHPNHDYSALTAEVTANPKAIFPASMLDADGTPHNGWGTIWAGPYYLNTRQFDINFNNVPAESCAKFVTALAQGHPDDLLVAGSGPDDMGGSVLKTDGSGKLDMDKVNYWCSGDNTSGPTVGVDIIGH